MAHKTHGVKCGTRIMLACIEPDKPGHICAYSIAPHASIPNGRSSNISSVGGPSLVCHAYSGTGPFLRQMAPFEFESGPF